MTGWAPPRQAEQNDWKNNQVIRLDSFTEVRAARSRWAALKAALRSALGPSAHALLCYATRDGRVHVWVNDEHGQPLDLGNVTDLQWLLDETVDLLGYSNWRL